MTISQAIAFGQNILNSRKEVETLLLYVLQKDKLFLILNQSQEVLESDFSDFQKLLFRRGKYEPIEYITNKVSFYSENFYIQEGALIPRPETEILIDKVIGVLENIENPRILEVGIGSGIISIMLAKLIPNLTIVAVDISEQALNLAQKNITKFKVSKQIELRQSNLFQNILDSEQFDLIVSNPPYIANSEKPNLQNELDFEPEIALFGGNIGDEILKKLILGFFKRDKTKFLVCEMGYDQKEKISNFVKESGKLEFYKDLANLDRGFILEKF